MAVMLLTNKVDEVELDDLDMEIVAPYRWHLMRAKNGRKYAYSHDLESPCGSALYMHRLLLNFPRGSIDHRDDNGLNNCRENLRLAGQSRNCGNQRSLKGGSSRYRGVYLHRGKWAAQIRVDYRKRDLGKFSSEIDAAQAYDAAAREAWGDFARLNFPEEQ